MKHDPSRIEFFRAIALTLAIALPGPSARADIITFADSSTFDYRYEMDAAPNNLDLDGNGTDDWWDVGVPTVSGGFAANTGADQIYRGDFIGSIWRSLANAADADWSFEISVAKTAGTQGANGWFGIAHANQGESNSSVLWIEDDRIRFNGTDYLVGTNFADGAYHTFRVVHDNADNELYAWVDGILLNDDITTPIAGMNGSAFDNSTFIGDYSPSGFAGDYSIDYIRVDSEAIGVVPEPGSLPYLALGLVALWRRVRRTR